MIGSRRVCASIASTACVALLFQRGTHAFSTTSTSMVALAHSFRLNNDNGKFFSNSRNGNGVFGIGTLALRPISMMGASSSDSASGIALSAQAQDHGVESSVSVSPFPQLYDNTLLSIQQCIDAYNQEQQQQQEITNNSKNNNNQSPKIVFIDGSWYHKPDPTTGLQRNPPKGYKLGPRLPNARYLDIDAIATTHELFPEHNPKGLPHMMPPPKLFGLAMDAYNIRKDDHVIVYAKRGALFTPRVWFLFICMGHDPKRVHLMQGSLEDYVEAGGFVDGSSMLAKENNEQDESSDGCYTQTGESFRDCFHRGILNVTRLHDAHYATTTPQYNIDVSSATHICGKEEVLDQVNIHLDKENKGPESDGEKGAKSSTSVIIDTRGTGYAKKGHMPSAIHLPYSQIASPDNALVIKPKSALKKLFEDRGIDYLDPELKIILSCGSGVSVCHGYLALKELGRNVTQENTRIYDGSWKEWGKEADLPKVLPDEIN